MCTGCSTLKSSLATTVGIQTQPEQVVPKSDTRKLVEVKYYGGGLQVSNNVGCSSCSSGKSRVNTREVIMFASEDEPNGIFQKEVMLGRKYTVTVNQAKYLCKMYYINQSGQKVPCFKEVKDAR